MSGLLKGRRHVHFVGIGGIGMSALARHLLTEGYTVSGSDRSPGQQGALLRELGADVREGHDAAHVGDADLLVVTSAVDVANPEIRAARARGITVMKRAELLGEIMNPRRGVAVAGTHGKTTTSALIGHLLVEAGADPTILIGGISANLGSNARVGRSDIVVAEADEYDASFLRLRPSIAVITNVEADHLDFYGTVEGVRDAFRTFARSVEDLLIVCADDPVAARVGEGASARVIDYGLESGEWRAEGIVERNERTSFRARHGEWVADFETRLAGLHNVRNALAAIAVASALDIDGATIASALSSFRGVGRRTEIIGESKDVLVIDDYGHHPSEIRTVLAALKARHRRPIRLVFQPHTYSRTRSFLTDFARAFEDADSVYLLDIYAARETDTLGISGRDLADAAEEHHPHVVYAETIDGALERLLHDARPGDLVITMGAGDVNVLAPRLLESLKGETE
jgi:UDP-N-acetylmuramate--alanine ligase